MVTRQPAHKLISTFTICFLFCLSSCIEHTRADTDTKKEATVKVHVALSSGKTRKPGWEATVLKRAGDTTSYCMAIPVFIKYTPDTKYYVSFSDSGGGSVRDTLSIQMITDIKTDDDDDDDDK